MLCILLSKLPIHPDLGHGFWKDRQILVRRTPHGIISHHHAVNAWICLKLTLLYHLAEMIKNSVSVNILKFHHLRMERCIFPL